MQGLFWAPVPPPPLHLFPPPDVIFHVKNLSDVGFIISLLKYIFRFPHISIFDFLDFEYFRGPQIVFSMFPLRLRKKQIIPYEMAIIQIRTSKC